jgi:hypothetical protein
MDGLMDGILLRLHVHAHLDMRPLTQVMGEKAASTDFLGRFLGSQLVAMGGRR